MNCMIELQNVYKNYSLGKIDVNVLHNVNLKIEKRDFVSIIGSSGSGKSTLLNILGCLDRPTSGNVLFDGNDVSTLKDDELARLRSKRIGFVFQFFNLIQTLTSLDNVLLPMIFANSKNVNTAKKLLCSVGLENKMMNRPYELSGGEQQRVAIARSLVNDPDIILADEPTGNLDSNTGKEILELLFDLNRHENKTLIIVTHDKNISMIANKIMLIKDGEVVNEK